MKRLFCLSIFLFSILSALSAHSGEIITGKFNIENPLSMYYAGNFSSDLGFKIGAQVLNDNYDKSDVSVALSLASRYFGIGIDLFSSISDETQDSSIYTHKFVVNFIADYGIENFTVGAKWKLNGMRVREFLDMKANFFRLAECLFTLHNDSYIEDNNSSLSFYAGFFDRKNISACIYSKDFLVLNQSNLSFVASSMLDNMGVSVMLKTSRFNPYDIRNIIEVIGSLSVDNILTQSVRITPALEFKFNIAKDTDISFINSVLIDTSPLEAGEKEKNNHSCRLEFNVFEYKLLLEAQIPFSTYRGSGDGAMIRAGFNITRG